MVCTKKKTLVAEQFAIKSLSRKQKPMSEIIAQLIKGLRADV